MKQYIKKISNKEDLSFEESKAAFELLMEGKAEDQEIFDFLTLLSAKGEASDEIATKIDTHKEKALKSIQFDL